MGSHTMELVVCIFLWYPFYMQLSKGRCDMGTHLMEQAVSIFLWYLYQR